MSYKTAIPWCESTWSPVDGCTPISTGCKRCYAAGIAKRFWGKRKFSEVQCHPDRLEIPLKWKKPRRIFVPSMGDLFHNDIPKEFIDRVLDVINRCPQHTFIVLTKRPERMYDVLYNPEGDYGGNCHLGVSCENQEQADKRIPILVKIPAAVRFISVEPCLSAADLRKYLPRYNIDGKMYFSAKYGFEPIVTSVICGCESGAGARETKIEWVRDLRDQCAEAGVPFFLKQIRQNGKLVKMPTLDGVVHSALPEGG